MTPELEVFEQLVDSDLPVSVIAGLFSDRTRCRRATGAMLREGEIQVLDPAGRPLPGWRYRELEGDPAFWGKASPYRLAITDVGADRMA